MLRWSCARSAIRCGVFAATVVLVVALGAGTASAHTEFVGSAPTDGEVVTGPLTEIVLEFTNPAEPSGDGFRVLEPDGVVRAPTSVDETDGTVFLLGFEPPLGNGSHAVTWEVRAGDAHPIDGSFRFDVVGTPTTTLAPTSTTAPEATPGTAAPGPTTTIAAVTLQEFLDDSSSDGASLGPVARLAGLGGTIFALGALAGLVWVVRGSRDELRGIVGWLRLSGIVIAVGGVLGLGALRSDLDVSLGEVLRSDAGLTGILEIVGGIVIWFGFRDTPGTIVAAPRSLSAATAHPQVDEEIQRGDARGDTPARATPHRWQATRGAAAGIAGLALVVAARWFDGHQATRGPRVLHAAVDTVHVLAAGCWAGGVIVMAIVAWRRRRSGPTDLAAMIGRFALPATVSLAAVALAGVMMTVMIIDDLGDVTSTEWGRLYVAKVVAVAAAAALGGFHRFRVHPLLAASPTDPVLARTARRLLVVEAIVMVAVVGVTAWLVGASV